MDLQKFWDSRQPMHKWSTPETALHKALMGDLVEWIRVMYSKTEEEPVILDVGCGSGRLFTTLSKQGIEADVVMVDFVNAAISLCEENTGHRPDMWDGEVLPYDDNSFDLVVMMDFLLHVHPDKVKQVVEEAKRVSRQYIYANMTEWEQPEITEETWCFAHDSEEVLEGLGIVLQKKYPAKKRLNAFLLEVPRVEKTIMEAIEEQMDEDFDEVEEEVLDDSDLREVEREDERDTDGDDTFSSDESSVPDDREVGSTISEVESDKR